MFTLQYTYWNKQWPVVQWSTEGGKIAFGRSRILRSKNFGFGRILRPKASNFWDKTKLIRLIKEPSDQCRVFQVTKRRGPCTHREIAYILKFSSNDLMLFCYISIYDKCYSFGRRISDFLRPPKPKPKSKNLRLRPKSSAFGRPLPLCVVPGIVILGAR